MAFKSLKKALLSSAILVAGFAGVALAASTTDHGAYEMKHPNWHFSGMFGTYDREAMQRGYQVYREICAQCHALEHLAFRHLGDEGAPFYSVDYPNPNESPMIKGLAADWEINDIDGETGDAITREAIPSDYFPDIFANIPAAQAVNNGIAPPDLSVIVKARTNGADYVYNLMLAYGLEAPHEISVGAGQYYNPVMEGGVISMAPPLSDDIITYEGENAPEATVEQMAADVVEFLAWSADPKLEVRRRVGFGTMLYLFFFSILLYLSYKRVWKNVKH